MSAASTPWYVLIHHLPPKPTYLRVRIRRLLDRIGAVAVKNTVYVLPKSDDAQEHFQWILREVTQAKGEATVFEARFVEGLRDAEVRHLFKDARDVDYRQLIQMTRKSLSGLPSGALSNKVRSRVKSDLRRLQRRLQEIISLDFFGGHNRQAAELVLGSLEHRLRSANGTKEKRRFAARPEEYRGRTWVTREDIHVDRMASAWLIRRFIDPKARFRFVPKRDYSPQKGELRFDMFEGEFTHEGDLCTFEVLVKRLNLQDPGLVPIQEMVHDIDLKTDKFGRPETRGLEQIIRSIPAAHGPDPDRLARASALLDDLYESFRKPRP